MLSLLLLAALPLQGFAAAALRAASHHAAGHRPALDARERGDVVHRVAEHAASSQAHASTAAADSNPSTCCQPAILDRSDSHAPGGVNDRQPPFVPAFAGSWAEPVPRKPPRS